MVVFALKLHQDVPRDISIYFKEFALHVYGELLIKPKISERNISYLMKKNLNEFGAWLQIATQYFKKKN